MKPPQADRPPVVLHSFQGGWGLRSLSPFCLKAEAMLTLAGVAFTVQPPSGPPKTRTGKLPALEATPGTLIEGSDAIADWLRDTRGIDLDQGMSAAERATALLLRRTIEEHLYFHLVSARWIDDAGYRMAMPAYFGHLPPVVRDLAPLMLRGGVKKSVRGQGIGRMTSARQHVRLNEDLDALSTLLGDRDWFFGDRPTTTDAIAYAFIGNVDAQPEPSVLRDAVRARANLTGHAQRLGALLFDA